MKRVAGILALMLVVSLLGASDVRGGAGALLPAGKTTGPALTATIVTDVTGVPFFPGKGLTSIRVQKAGSNAAVLFNSSYVANFGGQCIAAGFDLPGGTNFRFVGLMNGWVAPLSVRNALLLQFGNPDKAAITDTDSAACTSVDRGDGTGVRQILSFTAVIQFQP